ncbi:MAG TPA: hypothetical protein VKM55_04360 [Candidatus Lokiarchaeia archaeon]|nr:hypothetical protein [Candidatus Lokiarchaeia archaeon]
MSEQREMKNLNMVARLVDETNIDEGLSASEQVLAFQPTPVQARILQIAKEIMDDHYVLDSDQLYYRCIREIKDVAPQELNATILDLLKRRIIVHGKATTRQSVLDNNNRTLVMEAVKTNPGIHLNKLAVIVPINRGTIKWHLQMLAKFELVRSRNIDNQLVFYEFTVNPQLEQLYYILNKKLVTRITRMILDHPGISITAAIDALSIPRTTFLRKIKDMVAAGIAVLDMSSDSEACLNLSQSMEQVTRDFLLHCSEY